MPIEKITCVQFDGEFPDFAAQLSAIGAELLPLPVTTRVLSAPLLRASRTYGADSAETIAPRTTWVSTPSGRIIRTVMGRTHESRPLSMPDVGSTPRTTAKSHTPVTASQKSGTLAAVIVRNDDTRSAGEFGR